MDISNLIKYYKDNNKFELLQSSELSNFNSKINYYNIFSHLEKDFIFNNYRLNQNGLTKEKPGPIKTKLKLFKTFKSGFDQIQCLFNFDMVKYIFIKLYVPHQLECIMDNIKKDDIFNKSLIYNLTLLWFKMFEYYLDNDTSSISDYQTIKSKLVNDSKIIKGIDVSKVNEIKNNIIINLEKLYKDNITIKDITINSFNNLIISDINIGDNYTFDIYYDNSLIEVFQNMVKNKGEILNKHQLNDLYDEYRVNINDYFISLNETLNKLEIPKVQFTETFKNEYFELIIGYYIIISKHILNRINYEMCFDNDNRLNFKILLSSIVLNSDKIQFNETQIYFIHYFLLSDSTLTDFENNE